MPVYYWKVTVRDSAGQEISSRVLSFTTEALPKPDECTNIQAEGDIVGIEITWESPENTAIDGYYIERKDPDSVDFVLIGTVGQEVTEFIDSQNLAAHGSYLYHISAYNPHGLGNYSDTYLATVLNTPPLALGQDVNTFEDKSENIVLAGSDADNDNLLFEVLNSPSNGSLLGIAPNLTYIPNEGYLGTDSFSFRVNDGIENSEKAFINITILAEEVINENEEQVILLLEGWNLISFQINKCFYDGNMPEVFVPEGTVYEKSDSLAAWLSDDAASPLRDTGDAGKAGQWQRIISFDQEGFHLLDKDLPQDVNTLHYLSAGYGYWIKMNSPGVLVVTGEYLPADTQLLLTEGWNLIGFVPAGYCYGKQQAQEMIYPYAAGYYTQEENITYCHENPVRAVFADIEGKYRRIISFDPFNGGLLYDKELPFFVSTLHYLGPKFGYWIKVLEDTELVFPMGCGQEDLSNGE